MTVTTFSDLESFFRCPYAYRLDRTEAYQERITLDECLGKSVNDTIREFSKSRILGYRMKEEKVLESFWVHWDINVTKVYNPTREDAIQYIRIGEKCIRNFVHQSTKFGAVDIVASDMEGILRLPRNNEILVTIQELGRRGTTAFITKYIVDTEMGSREDLRNDIEMRTTALWAMDNIEAREIVMRWVFLVQDLTTELTASRADCKSAAETVSSRINDLNSSKDPLPVESDRCQSCQYQSRCPRFLHELSVKKNGPDRGSELTDRYLEIEGKKQALKNRIELLNAEQDALKAEIVAFSDSNRYMSLYGKDGKILIRHEKKAELPTDKTKIIARLKETGQYDSISMPNYSRLRSDIAKGTADPEIIRMANVETVDKIYIKRKDERY